ncbi:MAG: ABC transporter ATP-binding protein [Armatimonadota bacterium]|nr:ABC transporter ATP-binding protein [Armatimonadota bacterium]
MDALILNNVSVWFTRSQHRRQTLLQALAGISLQVVAGELVAIIGPSGCGKSTLLNAIAGLVPYEGDIVLAGRRVQRVPENVGYMFQEDALLPWRTVLSNVAFGLELRGIARRAREDRAAALLAAVGLTGFEHYYPHELSGGMAKRVALAQTLVYQPALLLMDEPFGALDAQTRLAVQDVFLRLWEQHRPTTVLVTHDIGEAVALADRVVVLSKRPGRVVSEHPISLPRPRVLSELRFDPRFVDIERRVWTDLRTQVDASPDLPEAVVR